MRSQLALTAMASVVAVFASCAGVSAHGYGDGYGYGYRDGGDIYTDRWYAAYERRREARERYRAKREERAYERHMAHQKRLAERRRRIYVRSWDFDRSEWRRVAHRAYRDYESYCDCPEYRDYAYGPRVYGYYGHYHHHGYGRHDHYGYQDYTQYMLYPRPQKNDRIWAPDAYPAGWPAWWLRMDREGRAGRN